MGPCEHDATRLTTPANVSHCRDYCSIYIVCFACNFPREAKEEAREENHPVKKQDTNIRRCKALLFPLRPHSGLHHINSVRLQTLCGSHSHLIDEPTCSGRGLVPVPESTMMISVRDAHLLFLASATPVQHFARACSW